MVQRRQSTFQDYRMWRAETASIIPDHPPYSDDMPVTPHSSFGDHVWVFPPYWFPAGAEARSSLEFTAPVHLDGTEIVLDPDADATLIRQLKEAIVVYIHKRPMLAENGRRVAYGKPSTAYNNLQRARRFLCAIRAEGCTSLHDLDPAILAAVITKIGTSDNLFDQAIALFQDLLIMSRLGLICGGLRPLEFELPAEKRVADTTRAVGWQPIPDSYLANILRLSNYYIDRAADIADRIAYLIADPENRRAEVITWAQDEFGIPVYATASAEILVNTLYTLVLASAGNLIAFHTGMRVSELLSIRRDAFSKGEGIAEIDVDKIDLEFTTYKLVQSLLGQTRTIAVHPRLHEAAQALMLIQESFTFDSDRLFLIPDFESGFALRPVTASTRWNQRLQRFCDLHGIDHHLTSHQWRKTIAAVGVRVLSGAAVALKELFGHQSLVMTARYILSSPFVRDEIRDLTLDEYRKRGRTLLESVAALGGDGLGGKHGKKLEAAFARLIDDTDITEEKLGQKLDDWVDDMLRQGIYPVPVMPGVFCMKPLNAMGACAPSSGDRLADPARCSATCTFQVQQAHRKPLLTWTIEKIAAKRLHWSKSQQVYWAKKCQEQLVAWPELVEELRSVIADWPMLKQFVEEYADAA